MISIVKAESWHEALNNEVTYQFLLNDKTDARWRILFSQIVEHDKIEIQGTIFKLTCPPENLETVFSQIKKAITEANSAYSTGAHTTDGRAEMLQDYPKTTDEDKTQERKRFIEDAFKKLL